MYNTLNEIVLNFFFHSIRPSHIECSHQNYYHFHSFISAIDFFVPADGSEFFYIHLICG